MLQQIMIPMAAFAITVTGASAFNPSVLEKIDVNLNDSQVSAIEIAHEMRVEGADRDEIATYLEANGVDQDTMKEIKEASREVRDAHREAVQSALENNDYDAFLAAIADSPLAENITSEADFEKFAQAHTLKEVGDREAAQALLSELGIETPAGRGEMHKGNGPHGEGREGGPRTQATQE